MFNRRLVTMPFLGIASGLPLALTSGTLQAWLTVEGLDIQAIGEEPERPADAPARMLDAIAEPLRQFFSRTNALVLLALIVLYKLGDAFAGSLTTAFLIGGMKFTLSDVGIINKVLGLGSSLLGVALGGALMIRWECTARWSPSRCFKA